MVDGWPACPRSDAAVGARFFVPLAIYAALTLVASLLSIDPRESLMTAAAAALRDRPRVYDLARGNRASTEPTSSSPVGAASAAFGIVQYGVLHYDNLGSGRRAP